ncbi:UvrD-helicase domain-containing protein [Patescibacteria group bacterium]|nr:UvrD-helicase domain-containing protein [Patescibacteria group bacterium]
MEHPSHLNRRQQQAVLHREGPLLILAGAGAGKTRTIVYRILNLIKKGAAPESILAVTFTNKAANEMRRRIKELIESNMSTNRPVAEQTLPFVSTFHSLGVHMLRENARLLGISRHFTIFDRSDSIRTIKQAIHDAGFDPGVFEPRKILGTISRQKGNAHSLTEYNESLHENEYYPRTVASIWERYEALLKNEKAYDFDDLLLKAVELLKENPQVLKRYHDTWHYIHIDEYQDTNTVQNEMAKLLAQKFKNICVVGDIDQTIYSWRGANIGNLLSFEKTFPGAKTIILEENYRSTKNIINVSNAIIEKNSNRPLKVLFTNNSVGDKLSLYGAYDEIDEARFVVEKTKELMTNKTPVNDIAVLYRANFQSRILEELFLDGGIPYHVLGIRFFDRKDVKDILSYLRASLNPESISDLKRIINIPPRGIGKVTLMRMVVGTEHECTDAMRKKISAFRALLKTIKETALHKPPSETLHVIISKTGIEQSLKKNSDDGLERLENIHELLSLAKKYNRMKPRDGIEQLLTDAALATDQDELESNKDGVKLMTVHASKGLEFDCVFITGLEDGLFPHDGHSGERLDTEEERRLFYVALTRARKKIFLSYASLRTIFGLKKINSPSEFIGDIDEQFLEFENKPEEKTVSYLD